MKSKATKQEEALERRYKDRTKYQRSYLKAIDANRKDDRKMWATKLYRATKDIKALCKKLGRDIPQFDYMDEVADNG